MTRSYASLETAKYALGYAPAERWWVTVVVCVQLTQSWVGPTHLWHNSLELHRYYSAYSLALTHLGFGLIIHNGCAVIWFQRYSELQRHSIQNSQDNTWLCLFLSNLITELELGHLKTNQWLLLLLSTLSTELRLCRLSHLNVNKPI